MIANEENKLIGIGLYSIPEAARLTHVPVRSIRRWLFGYKFRDGDFVAEMPAIWQPQVPKIEDAKGLGFLDLMELRFVQAFRDAGVSLTHIRRTAEKASRLFKKVHPFATTRFRTDGKHIFAEVAEEQCEPMLLDMVSDQYGFHEIIKPSLYEGIEFSAEDLALRWFPLFPNKDVIVDPRISFGKPFVRKGGVSTEVLAQAVKVEGDIRTVSRYFEVPQRFVRAAVDFERDLAA